MICLPVFRCTGACERFSEAFSRSSILRSCCSFQVRLSISRLCDSAWRSNCITTPSRPSSSASSKAARNSSSFASAEASIWSVSGSRCASRPQAEWTSRAFSPRYFMRASSSEAVSCSEIFRRSSVHCRFSSSICRSNEEICEWLFSRATLPLRLASAQRCWSSSRACSVSWEFWIKNKLDSSMAVNTSSNCFGSLKYSGMSSPLESSWNCASTASLVGYFFRILRLRASSSRSRSFFSSSSSRLARRRPLEAAEAACSSMPRSSASISACILAP
mmetsp:Transcript_87805/g.253212  ORF Transcript_87805/g.253212 Transcript_87805/m.253212 type:complete len:275 (-) Transcript_87805:814-1638(-)